MAWRTHSRPGSRRAHGNHVLLDDVVHVLSDGEEEVSRDVVHVVLCEADLQMNVARGNALQDVARLSRHHWGQCGGVALSSEGNRAPKEHLDTDGVLHSRAAEARVAHGISGDGRGCHDGVGWKA